jgi:hypothetical protein
MNSAPSSNDTPETSASSSIKRTPSQPKMREPLDFENDDSSPQVNLESLTVTTPKYMEFVDKQRFWIALLIGNDLEFRCRYL